MISPRSTKELIQQFVFQVVKEHTTPKEWAEERFLWAWRNFTRTGKNVLGKRIPDAEF